MPVRSLNSAVFKWPDREAVLSAARRWAKELRQDDPSVEKVLGTGSYARGDWGVGSDLDVIVVVSDTCLTPVERRARYEAQDIPVPRDLWVYTRTEWQSRASHSPHLRQRLPRGSSDLCQSDALPQSSPR